MKAGARHVPFQEACLPRVNFAHRFYLRAIACFVERDELESYVPAWDTLPKTGNASVVLWGWLLKKSRHVCFYFFFRIRNSRPRFRYSTSSMKCLMR
jgi:hypothetical protein